jgi:hypothetical protein
MVLKREEPESYHRQKAVPIIEVSDQPGNVCAP